MKFKGQNHSPSNQLALFADLHKKLHKHKKLTEATYHLNPPSETNRQISSQLTSSLSWWEQKQSVQSVKRPNRLFGLFMGQAETPIISLMLSHSHQANNEPLLHRQNRITASGALTPPRQLPTFLWSNNASYSWFGILIQLIFVLFFGANFPRKQ